MTATRPVIRIPQPSTEGPSPLKKVGDGASAMAVTSLIVL